MTKPTKLSSDSAAVDPPPAKSRVRVVRTLRALPPWAGLVVVLALLASLAPLAYTLRIGIVTTLTTVLLTAVVAQGWNILGGYGGYFNLGAAVFFGTGAYTAALLNTNADWSMWQGMPVAALIAVLVALPVGLATLRLRGFFFAIFTLMLGSLAQVLIFNTDSLGGSLGVYTTAPTTSSPRDLAALFYLMLLALTMLATVVLFFVGHSRFGYALRAIREDEDAAAVLGVRTSDVKVRALLVGAALAGLAGAVYAFHTGYIEPTGTFDIGFSLDVVLACVVGGLGTWYGPIIGSFVVVLLEQWLRTVVPNLHPFGADIPAEANRVVLGLLLIVFALYARRGIVGLFQLGRGRQERGRRVGV